MLSRFCVLPSSASPELCTKSSPGCICNTNRTNRVWSPVREYNHDTFLILSDMINYPLEDDSSNTSNELASYLDRRQGWWVRYWKPVFSQPYLVQLIMSHLDEFERVSSIKIKFPLSFLLRQLYLSPFSVGKMKTSNINT